MKGHYWLFVIGLLAFSACDYQQEKKPAYLLDEEKMVAIMVDMHLVETANNLKLIPNDSTYQANFASIFVSHETTKAAFDSSLYYFATKTDEMNVIYDKILEELYELESEVNPTKEQSDPS